MSADQSFSENVRIEIARRRGTYAAVAEAIGMDPRQFRRRTRGEAPWSLAEATAVARHLDKTVDALTASKEN